MKHWTISYKPKEEKEKKKVFLPKPLFFYDNHISSNTNDLTNTNWPLPFLKKQELVFKLKIKCKPYLFDCLIK